MPHSRLFQFLFFKSERFLSSAGVGDHYRKLSSLLSPGTSKVVYKEITNKKPLSAGIGFDIWYCYGHSEPAKGFELSDGSFFDEKTFFQSFPENPMLRPKLVFFNTCDSLGSGFVQSALASGVFCVIYTTKKILIKDMAKIAEDFFKNWAQGDLTIQDAIVKTKQENEKFPMASIGIGSSMLFKNIKKEISLKGF